jgi:hypothetical protein
MAKRNRTVDDTVISKRIDSGRGRFQLYYIYTAGRSQHTNLRA